MKQQTTVHSSAHIEAVGAGRTPPPVSAAAGAAAAVAPTAETLSAAWKAAEHVAPLKEIQDPWLLRVVQVTLAAGTLLVLSPVLLLVAVAVRDQRVQHEHVEQDDHQRSHPVGREDPEEGHDRLDRRADDAHQHRPALAHEDEDAGEQDDPADDQVDPAPGVEGGVAEQQRVLEVVLDRGAGV